MPFAWKQHAQSRKSSTMVEVFRHGTRPRKGARLGVRLCANCKRRKRDRRFSSGHGPLAREPLSKASTRGFRYRERRTEHMAWVCHAVSKASAWSTLPIQLPEPALPMTRRIAVNSLDSREGSSRLLQRSQSGRSYVCGHSPAPARVDAIPSRDLRAVAHSCATPLS